MFDLSVIVPCYNCENTIEDTCCSILNQTVLPNKIIFVNDGSKDNTLFVLNTLKEKYNDIVTVLDKPNGGVSSARNMGIKVATTNWIAFCDSDDIWLPDKLKAINEVIINNNVDFIAHAYYVNKLEDTNLVEKKIYGNPFLINYNRNFIQTSSVVVKKDLLFKLGLFNQNLVVAEDFDLWLSCLANARFFYIPQGLSIYRLEANNSLSSNELRMYYCTLNVLRKHIYDLSKFLKDPIAYAKRRMYRLVLAELWYHIRHFMFKPLKSIISIGYNEIRKSDE